MAKAAWIGLGVMGYPMAGYLQKAGHEVTVYNRTSATGDRWAQEYGGQTAPTPAQAAHGADFIFSCVGNDDDLRSVTLGENGAFSTLKADSIFIDHTTASAEIARDLYKAARERNAHFLDAPVSGGQAGAENGVLTVMVGGDQEPFARAQKAIDCFAQKIQLMGPSGSGQVAKMVNQICIAGLIQSLSEGIHFAQKAGLDIPALMGTISKGAAQSWQMENRWETMAQGEFDFGFAVDWMRKDLSIALNEAKNIGATLPVAALVDQFYGDVQNMGGNRWDTSSLITRLTKDDQSS